MLADCQMSGMMPARYLIARPDALWVFPALFLSILLAAIPMHFLYLSLLGRERYNEYTEYGNRKHGINSWKLLGYMAWVVVPVCIAFTILSFDTYARITDSAVVVNRFFSLGETEYNFGEIEFIELTKSFKAPNGNIVRRQSCSITFRGGSSYKFGTMLDELTLDRQKEIAQFMSSQRNIPVRVNDPYPAP